MSGLAPAFQFKLSENIQKKHVAIGRYDGKHPSLTFVAAAGKVMIHSPHQGGQSDSPLRALNINKDVTALAAGALDPSKGRDVVVVGTMTNLFAYDVESNSDVFYRDVPDGINCVLIGAVPGAGDGGRAPGPPLAVVGGNCSLQGFDHVGVEQFWTVTGDNVQALSFGCRTDNGRGPPETLLVGSDDCAIRVFAREEVVFEVTEADRVSHLCPLQGDRYGYALFNGTIGSYVKSSRSWRVKSKHAPTALSAFDLDADGVEELISGWEGGALNVRDALTGDVVFRDAFAGGVAGIVVADYRLDGRESVIVCATDGEVRGYLPVAMADTAAAADDKRDTKALEALHDRKRALMAELAEEEARLERAERERLARLERAKGGGGYDEGGGAAAGVGSDGFNSLPAGTSVQHDVVVNYLDRSVDLCLILTTDASIVSVVLVDVEGGTFAADTLVVSVARPGPKAKVQLRPLKNTPAILSVQVHVGPRPNSEHLHVFEFTLTLPTFCMYVQPVQPAGGDSAQVGSPPAGSVTFSLGSSFASVMKWVEQSFILTQDLGAGAGGMQMKLNCLRDGGGRGREEEDNAFVSERLWLQIKREDKLKFKIGCDRMELAGDVIQDLCRYLGEVELESEANFPDELRDFSEVLQRVADFHVTRNKLTADMAECSHRVKALVVKAEDARQLGEMQLMRQLYADLYTLNGELIGEYGKRANNHQALLDELKKVNVMISRASNLRMGKAKTRVVTESRVAIKANNFDSIFSIITSGYDQKRGGGAKK